MRSTGNWAWGWFPTLVLVAVLSAITGSAQAADPQATGLNAIKVEFTTDGRSVAGSFEATRTAVGSRLVHQWQEVDVAGNVAYGFVQIDRQPGMVTLYDQTRDVYVYLDMTTRHVLYGVGTAEPTPLYTILTVYTGDVPPPVTGLTVTRIAVSNDPHGAVAGYFAKAGGQWVEANAKGSVIHFYDVDAADSRVLVLRDDDRQLELVFDIALAVVNGRTAGQPYSRSWYIRDAM